MVRRVGGSIHQSVPATADIVRNTSHASSSSSPLTKLNEESSSSSAASAPAPSPLHKNLHKKPSPKNLSPMGSKQSVQPKFPPSVSPKGTKNRLATRNSIAVMASPPKPTKQNVPRMSIQSFASLVSSKQSLQSFASPMPTRQGFQPNKSKLSPTPGSKPAIPTGKDPDLKFGAKPSEIRAAAKESRDKVKSASLRKDDVRKREEAAALRMKKIKDEIDAIKEQEQECDREAIAEVDRERFDFNAAKLKAKALEAGVQNVDNVTSAIAVGKNEGIKPLRPASKPVRKRSKVEDEAVSRGTKELALEEMMAERRARIQKFEDDEQAAKILGGKAMGGISDLNMPMDELMHFQEKPPSDKNQNLPISAAVLAKAPPLPAKTSLEATPTGKSRKVPSRRGIERNPSNKVRIPEMRRRANQRDLLFDDDDKHRTTKTQGVHLGKSGMPKPNTTQTKPNVVQPEGTSKQQAKPKSSMVAAREARDAEKLEDERKVSLAQKAELEKARAHFDKGHDLCWKENNSAGALVDYRKALFTRESIHGKYHEETGRSYFWIAKSLTKLKDYDEALMAYSRAMRIFERVLTKNNKYNIWTVTAIEGVFRQMDDPDADFASYKDRLENTIRHEQSGDQLRKRGKLAEAIVEYREAIDNLEEYHPDAADLYCKIAIIMRQQGEFDRALEEYRFASEIYELSLGAEHPETVNTLNQLIEKKRLDQKSLALMEKLKPKN
jgi:tetratricopeptide (TPR) repeat protein